MDDTNGKMSETVDCTNISVGVPFTSSVSLPNADAIRLERYNVQDKTMFSNRSSIESNLSFPSREPSLLDELRTSLENKTFMKSRPHRNVSVDFSLSSSPGSHNSTLNANETNVVVPKGRKLNLFSRIRKKEVNINFTLGNESSSTVENEQPSDTSMNLSRNVAAKPGFKRPALKRVSVRFDCTDSSVSDDSKASLDQVSMLEDSKPKTRKIATLRSTRSGGLRKVNEHVNVDFTLNDTQASEVLTNDSANVSLSVPEESLNPLENKHLRSKQSGMLSVCSDDVPESNHEHSLDPIVLGASAQTSIYEGEQLIRDDCNKDDCNKPGSSENADVSLTSEIPRSHNNSEDSSMSTDISKISVAKTEFKRLKSRKEENQSALTNSDSFSSDDPVLPCFIHDEQSINQEPSKNLKIGDADTGESSPSGTEVVGIFQTKEQQRMEKSNLNSTNAGASCKSVESDLSLSMDTSKITVAKTKLKRPTSRKEVSVKFDCEASSLGTGIESSLNVENNQSIDPEPFNNLAPEGNVLAGQLFASSVSGGEARTILEGKKQRSCKKSRLNFAGAEESSISVDNISSMDVSKLTVDKTEFKRLRSQRVSVKFDCSDLSSDETETRDKSEIINDTTFTRRAQASGLRGSKAPNKNVTVNLSLGSLDRTGAPVETAPSNHELSTREMSCSSVVLPTNKDTPEDVDCKSGERDFPRQSLVPSGTPRVLDDVGKACVKQRSCNKSSLNFVSAEASCISVDNNSSVDVSQLTVAKTEFKRLRSQRVSVQFDCNASSDETETRDGSESINDTTFIGRQSTQASGWRRSEAPNENVTMDLSLGSLGRTSESVETAPSESESDRSGSELSVRDKSRSRLVLSANKDTPKDVDCEIDEGDFPKLLSETSRKLDHAVEKAFSKLLEHKKTDDPSLLLLGERTVMGCQENITDQNDELISYHPANCESKNYSASDFSNTFNKQSETRFSEDNMSLAISLEGSDERTETSLSYPAESSSSVGNEQPSDSSVNLSINVSSKPGLKRPASKRVSVKFECVDSSVSDVSKTSLDQVSVLDDSKPKTRKIATLRSTRSGGLRKVNEHVNVDFTLNDTQASEVLTNDSGSVSLSVPEDSLNPLENKYLRSEQSGMPSVRSDDAPQINSLNHEHSLDSVCLGASAETSIGEEKRMVTNDCCKPGLSENAEASVANESTDEMILEVSSCAISDVSMSLTKAGHASESCKENRIENIDDMTSATPIRVLVNESPNMVSDEPEFSNIKACSSRADIIIQNVPESVCATKHGTAKSPDAKSSPLMNGQKLKSDRLDSTLGNTTMYNEATAVGDFVEPECGVNSKPTEKRGLASDNLSQPCHDALPADPGKKNSLVIPTVDAVTENNVHATSDGENELESLAGGPPVIGSRVLSAEVNQSHEKNCTDEQLNLVVTLGDLDNGPESSVDDVSGAKLSNKSKILNADKKCAVSCIENRQQEYQKDADLVPTEMSPKQVSSPENFSSLKVKALETSNQPADIGKDISANMLPSVHEIINVDAIDPPPSCKSSLDASKLVESSRQDQPGPFVNDNARQTVQPSHEESIAQITEEHNRDQRNRGVPVLNTGDHSGVLNLVATSTSSQTRPSTSRDGLNRVNENPVSNDCGSADVETIPPSSSDVCSVLPAKNGEVPRRIQPSDNDSLGTLKSKEEDVVSNLPHPKSILVDTVNRQTPAGKHRKSKRKSISFKPAVENLYHSPPDYHCNGSNQNLSTSTSRQKGEGYDEFSRIQMTSEISEIQTSMRVTRSKRHYSSTPLPKSKKRCVPFKDTDFTLRREAKPDDEIFAKPVTLAGLANNEFLVPPPPLFAAKPSTRLSSGGPRPDSPLSAVGPAEPSPKDEKENQAAGGDSSSSEKTSVDLSYENSLNISAIPKDKTDHRRDNVFHSTPLHRTKTSKTKSKKKYSSGVPHSVELGVDRNLVNDRSVNTSRKLRSRSRQESFLSESEGSSHSRDSDNSETRSRSRSSRSRSDSQTESLQGSPQVSAQRFAEESSNDYSSPNRISIKDDTVLSSQATSHSRARGFTSKSSRSSYLTRESSLMSYDSHRKLPSRRLFTHDALGDEENTDDLSNKEASGSTSGTSISKSPNSLVAEEPSTKHTDLLDENDYEVAALSSPQPPVSSRDDSVTSSGSGAESVASYIVPHESLKSQIDSLRRISRASSVSSDGSEVSLSRKDPHLRPKNDQTTTRSGEFKIPRSKFSLSRKKSNSENIVIFPKIPKRSKGRLAIESGGDESQVEWSQKPRKLFKPGKWASKKLYRWLELNLREEHGLRTTLMAEKMVIELQHAYLMVVNGHLSRALETVRDRSVELGLCTTELEFWSFIHKFMPFDFRMKVINMGGAFGSAVGPRTLPNEAL